MIPVEREPDEFRLLPLEYCCFCFSPTPFWYTPKDVAVCPSCAETKTPDQVPSKSDWSKSCIFLLED